MVHTFPAAAAVWESELETGFVSSMTAMLFTAGQNQLLKS